MIPEATASDIAAIQQLAIAAKNCRSSTSAEGGLQWHKSIHRSFWIEDVGVHRTDGHVPAYSKVLWADELGQDGSGTLQMLHARKWQAYVNNHTTCAIDGNLTDWLYQLVQRTMRLSNGLKASVIQGGNTDPNIPS